ncbi:MAG: choice-of-anchor J domain-containing protein, partial [Myxococcota bacterium]
MLLAAVGLSACNGDKPEDSGIALAGPTLDHTPPAGVLEGTPLTVTVTATDADDVAAVTLFHRVSGETTWVQAPMVRGDDDVWSTELEATDIDDPALEYYFKAEDAGDTPATSYLPAESTASPFELSVSVIGTALPFVEGFEHAEGEQLSTLGWGNASLGFRGYSWETTTAQAHAGSRSVFHSRGHTDASAMEDWLITPALDFSAASTAQVTWREYGVNVDEADHGLYVSTGSRDPSAGDYVAVVEALPAPSEGAWGRSAVYDLSAYAGEPTVYLAWRFVGQAADDWHIDDVRVEELQPDLVIGTTVSPSPIDPGGTGTFTVEVENLGSVDTSDLSVVVTFPEGGASVAEASVPIDPIATGGTGTAAFSLAVDAATPDNAYVPYEITVTDAATTWTASGDLLVGLASTADITWSPSADGDVVLSLGVGDPDAPTWEEVVYDGTGAAPVVLSVDITDQGALLPPAAGALRWYLRVDSAVAGTIDDFAVTYDGVAHEATVLPVVAGGTSSHGLLPEPPS